MFDIPPGCRGEVFVAVLLWPAYYEASRLLYVSSPPVVAYVGDICNAYCDDVGQISMSARTKNLLMKLECVFAACCDRPLSHTFGYVQSDFLRGSLFIPLQTVLSVEMNIVGQYEAIFKAVFEPLLTVFALYRSSEVEWNSSIVVEHQFQNYSISIREFPSLLQSNAPKRQRSGSEALVPVPGRDVVWWPGLVYASSIICRVCCRASHGEIVDDPAEIEVSSVSVPEMDDLVPLSGKDTGSTEDVCSDFRRLVEKSAQ